MSTNVYKIPKMKMKFYFLSIAVCLVSGITYGQCDCEKIARDDGTTITQCNSLPIAFDNSTQVGIAAASNGQEKFITITVRFKSAAKDISGDLSIRLSDNSLITFELINAQLAYIGNSEVAQGVFLISESQIGKLKKSEIKTISFKLQDGLLRTFEATSNAGILKKQISCL